MAVSKVKKFINIERPDENCELYIGSQEVRDPDTEELVFFVFNLTDCPEDAIIDRCLFDASDWLGAVNYGIELGKAGYDIAEMETVDKERDE
jgi:hypothetical protein